MCCDLDEDDEATEIHFLNGLNKKVQDILVDMEYNSFYDLIDLANEIENRINNNNTCLPEIEHHDTHIVDALFATNLRQDIEIKDGKDNMLKKDKRCTKHVNTGTDMGVKIAQGEQNFDVLHSTTIEDVV